MAKIQHDMQSHKYWICGLKVDLKKQDKHFNYWICGLKVSEFQLFKLFIAVLLE
jgi:hypothetical protein